MRDRAFGALASRELGMKCLWIVLLISAPVSGWAQAEATHLRTLATVHDVFALNRAEAARSYPIKLDAVVTFSDPDWGLLFIQDRTGTTFIDVHGIRTAFKPGQRIEVRAQSVVANNGPAIGPPAIAVLGMGPLPRPEPRSIAELDRGAAESHRVETEGVLRPCDEYSKRICYQVFDGAKRVWMAVPQPNSTAADALIGARVRVTGIVGEHQDAAQKRVGAQLFVESLADMKVLEAPAGPGSPAAAIGDLRAADADTRFVRQVHIRGKVIWSSPSLAAVRDSSGTVFVAPAPGSAVRTGSIVDAIGFPSHGAFGLNLASAAVSAPAMEQGATEPPIGTTASEILRRSLHGRRVRMRARLVAQNATQTEFVYQLQEGGQRFNAVLLRSGARGDIVGLAPGSVLEVTGAAFIQRGNPPWPDSLLVLIESPADIAVVAGPGWLTPMRALAILAAMALCVLIPLVWVSLLRRTVRQQTGVIRTRLESEMHLETRFRRLFERNLAAVFTWQPDGAIVDCNMAFVRMLGLRTREGTIGRNYWEMEADPDKRDRLRTALKGEALSNVDGSLRRDDGAIVYLLQNITPVDAAGRVVYETTAIDVSLLKQNQAELQKAKDAAVHESLIDALTDLPNRRCLMEMLDTGLEKARREALVVGFLYVDLDGFKLVNDSLGHPVGDALLRQVAAILRSWIRAGDMLARLGGDEFMVILNGLRDKQDATRVTEDLLRAISCPFHVRDHELSIGASIGISIFPDDSTDAEALMQQADSAMYAAKRAGKNRAARFTPEMGLEVHERLSLENLLRGAVARNEIYVHYQPEFDLATRRLLRFEALARWNNPTIGEVSPGRFIPIAEESGIIGVLGAHIMELASIEAARWQKIAPHPIQVAVNVSGMQLRRRGFVEEVRSILQRTGLPPQLLQIELTESVMLDEGEYGVGIMVQLKEMGISLAVDDFGTGYSNLSYLPSLPFNILKVDGVFIRNMGAKPESPAIIRTLVSLAHNIGMRVIVEGVETSEQLELISALGADEVQGFLTGRPVGNPVEVYLLPVECPA